MLALAPRHSCTPPVAHAARMSALRSAGALVIVFSAGTGGRRLAREHVIRPLSGEKCVIAEECLAIEVLPDWLAAHAFLRESLLTHHDRPDVRLMQRWQARRRKRVVDEVMQRVLERAQQKLPPMRCRGPLYLRGVIIPV